MQAGAPANENVHVSRYFTDCSIASACVSVEMLFCVRYTRPSAASMSNESMNASRSSSYSASCGTEIYLEANSFGRLMWKKRVDCSSSYFCLSVYCSRNFAMW